MAFVAALSAFGRTDIAVAGGKGANLGELTRAGFPVPPGFVITTDAHAAACAKAGARQVPIPDAVRDAIAGAYAGLGSGPVAVRSSATAEDLPAAAFAGQHDSYLNVVGEADVLDAVRRCWGSLWTDRAVAYRRRFGIDSSRVRMAVVVQDMVDAEVAGVLFTADPVTGHRGQLVVDASAGLGEAVVSGLVTPDHYVLDARGKVGSWTPGGREVVVRAAAGGGVTRDEGDSAPAQPLPDEVLEELAGLGTAVAVHFGRPQDVEWACADGRVMLLQTRPITALPPPPVRLNRRQRQFGATLLEYVSVRPYPIDMTTWVPNGPAGMMARVTEYFGIRGAFEGFLRETDGVVDRFVPPSPRPSLRMLGTPFRLVSLARRFDPGRWTEDPRLVDYLARVRDLASQDLSSMPWPRLVRFPGQALDLVQSFADLRISYLPGAGFAAVRLLVALNLLRLGSLAEDLLVGAATRTADANRALAALAQRVREDPRLKEAVDSLDPRHLTDFPDFPDFPDFSAGFAAFLAEYGHRETATALFVTPPTWADAPETVLGLIKVLASAPPKAVDLAAHASKQLLGHPRLRDPKRRARMERRVERARAAVAFREDSHFYFTKPQPLVRRSLLEIGRRLHVAGVLGEPEDVFHLRWEEIAAIDDVAGIAEPVKDELRAAVRARSARREELSGVPLIDPRLIFPGRDGGDAGGALVSGTPAGGGTVTAKVKVIRDPAEFGTFAEGEVLVCPYTNPAWTPLFQRAAAVVVDSGAPTNHAAIVAREYGLPTITGTADGTSVLTDGQVVTVDGSTGRVTLAP